MQTKTKPKAPKPKPKPYQIFMQEKERKPLIGFKLLTDNKEAEKSKESDVERDENGDFLERARD